MQEAELRLKRRQIAHELLTDPDDIDLSISLDIPLLTRDKPLYTGLRKKGFRNVLLFNEFLALQQ